MNKLKSANEEQNKNNSLIIYEDIDVDRYMSLIEDELKKLEYSLNDRGFIANIINILDKLISPKKFNKTIFFHILDFSNLNIESPILLRDFFRSFFIVYESMKRNRESLAENILIKNKKIEKLKADNLKLKSEEVFFENGLTNFSTLTIKDLNQIKSNLEFDNSNSAILSNNIQQNTKIIFKYDNFSQILYTNNNKLIEFKVSSPIEKTLKIYAIKNDKESYIDTFDISNCLNKKFKYSLTFDKEYYEYELLWVISKVNYLNQNIVEYEEQVEDFKLNISLLNNCVNHIEGKYNLF